MTVRRFFACLFSICILICCFAMVASSDGFIEIKYKSISKNQNGYTKYTIVNRAELEGYAVFGSMSIQSSGEPYNSHGVTFQAFFECLGSHVESVDGKNIPEVLAPARTVVSYTADENDETISFVSKKAEYDKPVLYSGNMHCLWQIEPDGDYTAICSSRDTGFLKSMGEYY